MALNVFNFKLYIYHILYFNIQKTCLFCQHFILANAKMSLLPLLLSFPGTLLFSAKLICFIAELRYYLNRYANVRQSRTYKTQKEKEARKIIIILDN